MGASILYGADVSDDFAAKEDWYRESFEDFIKLLGRMRLFLAKLDTHTIGIDELKQDIEDMDIFYSRNFPNVIKNETENN